MVVYVLPAARIIVRLVMMLLLAPNVFLVSILMKMMIALHAVLRTVIHVILLVVMCARRVSTSKLKVKLSHVFHVVKDVANVRMAMLVIVALMVTTRLMLLLVRSVQRSVPHALMPAHAHLVPLVTVVTIVENVPVDSTRKERNV